MSKINVINKYTKITDAALLPGGKVGGGRLNRSTRRFSRHSSDNALNGYRSIELKIGGGRVIALCSTTVLFLSCPLFRNIYIKTILTRI